MSPLVTPAPRGWLGLADHLPRSRLWETLFQRNEEEKIGQDTQGFLLRAMVGQVAGDISGDKYR